MTLQEAIKSGKRFKRPSMPFWLEFIEGQLFYTNGMRPSLFTKDDFVTDQWITEPIKKELSREDIERAYYTVLHRCHDDRPQMDSFFGNLIKDLGL